MKKSNFKLFKDILMENDRYSQGRVYLFWSVVAYYLVLAVLTVAGISRKFDIEIDKFAIIIEALKFAITLFGGYVFGGKFIKAYETIKGNNSKSTTDETEKS